MKNLFIFKVWINPFKFVYEESYPGKFETFPTLNSQIYGDPEAADVVFTCGADVVVVGINVTTQVKLTGIDPSFLFAIHCFLWF